MALVSADGEIPRGLGFPVALAGFAMRHPRPVIAAFAITLVLAAVGAARVKDAEDLLDFIPPDDPDVRLFKEVGHTFGALRVALVGIEAPPGEDLFSAATLERVAAATAAARGVRGIDSVDSVTAIEDVVAGEGGAPDTRQLVELDHLPRTAEEQAALRSKVMSRPSVVGNLVSRDGRAALILAYLADGASDRLVSHALHQAVQAAAGGLTTVYGGAPFAGSAIYDETQADVRRLTPLALVFFLAVILIVFRDPLGVLLTIATVVWAALVVMAGMAFVGEPVTPASSTLPVMLFASGTSYALHLLGRYYVLAPPPGRPGQSLRELDGQRLLSALRIVGPPVTIAALSTAASFLALLVMDIRPLRAFGVECAAGVTLALLASFLLVPAVLALYPRGQQSLAATGNIGELLVRLSELATRRRDVVLGLMALATAGGVWFVGRIQVRMEARQFFSPGSEPWLAERFLADKFGGSQILQIRVRGDFTEPAALHELKRMEQYARSLPDVTQATSVVDVLMQLNEVMGGGHRIPDTRAQVPQLLFFVEGKAFLKRLLTSERDQALVLVRTHGDSQRLVREMEAYLSRDFVARPAGPTREQVADRLRWLTRAAGEPIAEDVLGRILEAARRPDPRDTRLVEARRALATAILTAEDEQDAMMPRRRLGDPVQVPGSPARTLDEVVGEFAGDLRPPELTSPLRQELLALAASPEEGALAWAAYAERLAGRTRAIAVDDALRSAGPLPAAALPAVRDALGDLFPEPPIAAVARPLSWSLAGEPILERGMSRSVRKNHIKAQVVAAIAVALFNLMLFRTVRLAAICVVPAACTLVILFGATALLGMPIDLGTSLVSCIGTGAGSEITMQYLWYLKRSTPIDVVRFVGPIMVLSTLLIAAGFAVLAFGHSQPMRMFGSLAALSMVGAAGLTFVLVPSLSRREDAGAAVLEEKTA